MNIMLFTTGTVIGTCGGAEKIFFDMANNLANRGHNICAVAFDDKQGIPFWKVNSKVEFHNIGVGNSCSNLYINLRTFYIVNKAKRHCERFRIIGRRIGKFLLPIIKTFLPDIIIVYDRLANFVVKESLKTSIPVIFMFHSSPDAYLEGDGESVINKSLESSDCIQVLVPEFLEVYEKYIKVEQKKVVIGNPVVNYNNITNEWGKVIVNVGRINKDTKRQHLLLLAFARIKEKFPDWKIKFYGDSTLDKIYTDELNDIVKNNNLEDNVDFCGTVKEIENVLRKASIFVFPSSHEGFGLALAEAMSVGIPCVGYKSAPGVNHLIKDGYNGYLVNDGIIPLSNALEKLMKNEELRKKMGKNAKEDMKQYSPEIIWDKWEKLIYDVVNDKKK